MKVFLARNTETATFINSVYKQSLLMKTMRYGFMAVHLIVAIIYHFQKLNAHVWAAKCIIICTFFMVYFCTLLSSHGIFLSLIAESFIVSHFLWEKKKRIRIIFQMCSSNALRLITQSSFLSFLLYYFVIHRGV